MPNVAHLLNVALDDPSLQIPLCPVGTWRGELVKVAFRDTDSDGNVLTDKNGDEYAIVRLLCRPEQPAEDVDRKEAKAWLDAGAAAETILDHATFIRGKRSMARAGQLLASLGVPTAGRSLKDVAEQYRGGVPVHFEVTHRTDDKGEDREDIAAIYPAG